MPYVLQRGQIDDPTGPDGNTEIFDAPEGLVVVDTGRHLAHARAILDYANNVGKPIVAVVNSHWHLDHTTGNHDLFAAYPQARLVATGAMEDALTGFLARTIAANRAHHDDPGLDPARRARIKRFLTSVDDRRAIVPADPVTHDETLALGGRSFELHVAPAAATETDLWLTVPDENLAVAGDLVTAPVPLFDTGCAEGWGRALDAIARADWTTLVPGHGEPMDRAAFDRWHAAFDAYVDCAKSDASAKGCAAEWERDAAGFIPSQDMAQVREMAVHYVEEILRAPADKQMGYCA